MKKNTWSVNQLFFISINEKLFDQNMFIVLPLTELSATLSFAQFETNTNSTYVGISTISKPY